MSKSRFSDFNRARMVLLVALLFTTLGAGVFRTPPILFMAAVLLGAPLVGALVGRLAVRCLKMTRVLPESGTVGNVVHGRFMVSNTSRWPLLLVHGRGGEAPSRHGKPILELVEAGDAMDFVVPLLMPGASVTWEMDWRLARRGKHTVGPGAAGALDPLGLYNRLDARTPPHQILVLPRPVKINRLGWSGGVSGTARTTVQAAKVAEALDFHGIRPQLPGEGLRRIHWKSTARTGVLHVMEWEEELAADLTVLLDTQAQVAVKVGEDALGGPMRDTFETAIVLAASMATYLLENGYQFQLLFWEKQGTELLLQRHEARNLGGLPSIMAALARVETVEDSDATLPKLADKSRRLIPPGRGVLALTTDLADVSGTMQALARASGARPQGLVLDALSFAAQGNFTPVIKRTPTPPNVKLLRYGESLAGALEKGA